MSSGKCFACASSFGFFKKEHGCKNCGFAFCSSCLPHKDPVPKHNNKVLSVCINCHLILTGKKKQEDRSKYSPPEALKKRLAALDQPNSSAKQSASSHALPSSSRTNKIDNRLVPTKGMSPADVALEQRLLKLKEDRKKAQGPIPSEEELSDRLAKLKGVPLPDERGAQQPWPSEKRSEQEQIDDLMTQMTDEVGIDAKVKGEDIGEVKEQGHSECQVEGDEVENLIKRVAASVQVDVDAARAAVEKDEELMRRLKNLREQKEGEGTTAEEEEDEEEIAKKIVEKILDEQRLEERSGPMDSSDEEELPWCCICNNDASLRCHGCDGDLYCQRCYKEGHARSDYSDHTTEKYKKKR